MNFALLNILQHKQIWMLPLSAINPSAVVSGRRLKILFIYLSIFPLIKYSWLLLITRNYCNLFVLFPGSFGANNKSTSKQRANTVIRKHYVNTVLCRKLVIAPNEWPFEAGGENWFYYVWVIMARAEWEGYINAALCKKVELACLTVFLQRWRRATQ